MLPTRIIFVRHGRSTYNEQGRYQGSSDQAVLTAHGHHTAQLVGQALQTEKIDAIYASPLQRVQQTVDAIGDYLPHTRDAIALRNDLREIDLPAWEGLPYQTVRTQQVDAYRCWIERPDEFQMPRAAGSEPVYPVRDLYARAHQFWQDVLLRHGGETVLVVSHGGTIHALISTALGLIPKQHHCLQQSNCGISVLEFAAPTHTARLEQLNDTTVIGESLPKLKAGKQGLRLLLLPVEPDTPLHNLHDRLASVHLNFSLQTWGLMSDVQTTQLLRHHPETVQLQVQRDDFVQAWQQTLLSRQQSDGTLVTGLAIASPAKVQNLLTNIVGIAPAAKAALAICPGTLSIVHYANSQPQPILQGLNIHASRLRHNANSSQHLLPVAV